MRRLGIAFAALPLPVAAALADSDPGLDLRKADEALNAALRQVQNRLSDDAGGKALLVKAPRAWIAFRDAECTFQSSGEDGGSVAPMVAASRKATLTTHRTKQLKAYLNCQEGDLACPVPAQ